MKFYTIAIATSLVAGFGTANISLIDTKMSYQTVTTPEYEISFDRGSYEIIEFSYDSQTILSDQEMERILRFAGFTGDSLMMALAVAFRESTFRPYALNKSSSCYGLFQINMSGSLGKSRREKYGLKSNTDLFNPLVNAKIAYQMSSGGKNWSAWTTAESARKSLD